MKSEPRRHTLRHRQRRVQVATRTLIKHRPPPSSLSQPSASLSDVHLLLLVRSHASVARDLQDGWSGGGRGAALRTMAASAATHAQHEGPVLALPQVRVQGLARDRPPYVAGCTCMQRGWMASFAPLAHRPRGCYRAGSLGATAQGTGRGSDATELVPVENAVTVGTLNLAAVPVLSSATCMLPLLYGLDALAGGLSGGGRRGVSHWHAFRSPPPE